MLKRSGFFRNKKSATKTTSMELPDHVTTIERNRTCFLESETTKERINLKAVPVKSSPSSLSITYEKIREFRNKDLKGHIFPLPLGLHPDHHKLQVLDQEIPKLFLVTEDIIRGHITKILSETCLSSSTQKRLVTAITNEACSASHRRGFKIELEIEAQVDHVVEIGCGCKGKQACPWRVIWDRHVSQQVSGTDCPICLSDLSNAVSRMELRCSHVFHTDCALTWLNKNPSCPICRAQDLGETASIY